MYNNGLITRELFGPERMNVYSCNDFLSILANVSHPRQRETKLLQSVSVSFDLPMRRNISKRRIAQTLQQLLVGCNSVNRHGPFLWFIGMNKNNIFHIPQITVIPKPLRFGDDYRCPTGHTLQCNTLARRLKRRFQRYDGTQRLLV